MDLGDLPVSTRRQPFVGFDPKREAGNDLLTVSGLSKSLNGEQILKNVSFTLKKGDKVAFVGQNDVAKTLLFDILAGEVEPDAGSFTWGITTTRNYFPTDNSKYFNTDANSLVEWPREYSEDKDESFPARLPRKVIAS